MFFAQANATWLRYLGFDSSSIPEDAEVEFEFRQPPAVVGSLRA